MDAFLAFRRPAFSARFPHRRTASVGLASICSSAWAPPGRFQLGFQVPNTTHQLLVLAPEGADDRRFGASVTFRCGVVVEPDRNLVGGLVLLLLFARLIARIIGFGASPSASSASSFVALAVERLLVVAVVFGVELLDFGIHCHQFDPLNSPFHARRRRRVELWASGGYFSVSPNSVMSYTAGGCAGLARRSASRVRP